MVVAEKKNRITPFLGTLIFHTILFLIFYLVVFHTPIPPYPEQSGFGVEVALGTSDEGMGNTPGEPAPSKKAVAAPSKSTSKDKSSTNTENPVASQNTEDNPYLGESKKQKQEKPRTSNPAAEYKKSPKDNSGGKGITGTPGYQGNPNGNPNSNNYNGQPGTGGDGPGGDGNSYQLGSRRAVHKEIPDVKNINERAVVVVNIWVDRDGIVTRAERGLGTLSANPFYINKAIEAAKKVKWEASPSAPELQLGKIKYVFSPE
jgi:hypothetical protein